VPEGDFAATHAVPERPTFLAGTSIELLGPLSLASPPRHALFDFDGTLSLVREGWMEIMVPMMVEFLLPCAGSDETQASLETLVRNFVSELTGKQTIYQMMRFVEEIRHRGGTPLEAQAYKDEYHSRLMTRIADRREGLASGKTAPKEYLVPGSQEILEALRSRDVAIYIASGTDEAYVIEEARLLGLEGYAPGRIYGAQKDHLSFSKEMVIRRILSENHVEGSSLLAFGDGYVEISDCKAAGGTAIAVASDEAGRSGKADPWKRGRLIAAGADLVIPDYQESGALIDWIWSRVGTAAASKEAAAIPEAARP
jgi:phosphoglycolate phosphatase-like HAD superfamily hydrolase